MDTVDKHDRDDEPIRVEPLFGTGRPPAGKESAGWVICQLVAGLLVLRIISPLLATENWPAYLLVAVGVMLAVFWVMEKFVRPRL